MRITRHASREREERRTTRHRRQVSIVTSERRPREKSRDNKGGDEVAVTSDYFKG